MCRYVYLASDAPLPLIKWDEGQPEFNVAELLDYDREVAKQFSKLNIVFLGAYTGCSCGFYFDGEPPANESEEIEDRAARESMQALIRYLSQQAQKSSLEMFTCWNGDQGKPPVETLTVSPDFFDGSEFPVSGEPTLFLISHT